MCECMFVCGRIFDHIVLMITHLLSLSPFAAKLYLHDRFLFIEHLFTLLQVLKSIILKRKEKRGGRKGCGECAYKLSFMHAQSKVGGNSCCNSFHITCLALGPD